MVSNTELGASECVQQIVSYALGLGKEGEGESASREGRGSAGGGGEC